MWTIEVTSVFDVRRDVRPSRALAKLYVGAINQENAPAAQAFVDVELVGLKSITARSARTARRPDAWSTKPPPSVSAAAEP